MPDTSASFLQRLKSQPKLGEWDEFLALYQPLIRRWLGRQPALQNDVEDIVQDVLAVVVRKLPSFQRQRTGSFRLWLRSITVNCVRDHWKARRKVPLSTGDSNFLQFLEQMEDPQSGVVRLWDEEHDRHVTRYLLNRIKRHFEPQTWKAFQGIALEGRSPAEVAKELGVTVNAVFIAKSRVMSRLRQEGSELLD